MRTELGLNGALLGDLREDLPEQVPRVSLSWATIRFSKCPIFTAVKITTRLGTLSKISQGSLSYP